MPGHSASGSRRWLQVAAAESGSAALCVSHLRHAQRPWRADTTERLAARGVAAHLGQRRAGRAHDLRTEQLQAAATQRTCWSDRWPLVSKPRERRPQGCKGGVSGRAPIAGMLPAVPNDALVLRDCTPALRPSRTTLTQTCTAPSAVGQPSGHGRTVLRAMIVRAPWALSHRCDSLSAASEPLRAVWSGLRGGGERRDESGSLKAPWL